ncbi:MAG: ABC transporter substrate-binding protein [Alphaproteobacteria bacterium]|nr:ABC transporter substrate-binding protein [Alphaproteobacteria bacterium]
MYSRRFILGSLAMSALAMRIKPARGAEPLRIRVGWVVVPNDMMPILPEATHVTKYLGKTYVLDMQHFAGTTPIITALASGAIDTSALAFSSLPLAIENAKLDDLRVIADAFQDGAEGYRTNTFRVLKDSPIRRVEELKGKVLATNTQGSAVDIAMRAMLRKHGLDDRTDVSIIEARFPAMRSLLQEAKVALIPAVEPFAADPELEKISRPLFTQKEAIGQTQMIIHAAREGFLKKHRAAMTDMLEDMLRVLHFYTDPAHHEQAVQVVAKITKQPTARFESWLFTKRDYYRNPDGLPNLKALQANITTERDLGFLKTAIDINKYADLSLVRTAAKRLASKT